MDASQVVIKSIVTLWEYVVFRPIIIIVPSIAHVKPSMDYNKVNGFFMDLHRMTLWFVEQVLSFGWSNNACFNFECSVVLNQIQKVNYLIYGYSSISPNPFSWISLRHMGMQNLLLTGLQTKTSSTSFLFLHGWKILDIGLNPLNISLSSMFIENSIIWRTLFRKRR